MKPLLQTAIVILNYNNYEDTINCIKSVMEYNSARVKYIVVDNGSTRKGTVECLDVSLKGIFGADYSKYQENDGDIPVILSSASFLVSPTNDGYARGNNKGLRLATRDPEIGQILILNNDILFIEDILPKLINGLYTLPHAGIVSPLLLKRDKKDIDFNCARINVSNCEIIFTYLLMYRDVLGLRRKMTSRRLLLKKHPDYMHRDFVEMELPSGSCMLFKKELMEKIKLFDGNTFLYYEENIIFKQEERIGVRNYLLPNLRCVHLGASSTKNSMQHSYVLKVCLDSACYYLKAYGHMTLLQKIALPLARLSMELKCKIIQSIEKRNNK